MYPDEATLMEVGRIAIAAGRLDAELGRLYWHLAPDLVEEIKARRAPAAGVRKKIRTLAVERLDREHSDRLVAFIDESEAVQTQRNEVLHANWLLRDRDAMRPVSEFAQVEEDERPAYHDAWAREARASDDWQRQPNDAVTLTDRHHLDELVAVERRLRVATEVCVNWYFRVASMREADVPAGWQGPPEARRGPQPLPPGAIVGPEADALLEELFRRPASDAEDTRGVALTS